MALTKLQVSNLVLWELSASFGGRAAVVQKDSARFGYQADTSVQNKIYAKVLTFTSGEVKTLDLTNVTAPSGEALTFTGVNGIFLRPVGQSVTVAAGGTNGLVWRAETVPDGGNSSYYQPVAKVVDSTHKTISLTAGAGAMTLEIAIWGTG